MNQDLQWHNEGNWSIARIGDCTYRIVRHGRLNCSLTRNGKVIDHGITIDGLKDVARDDAVSCGVLR